jgi:8-oxo-dGTP diphosphatase
MATHYCCGFLFSPSRQEVVLILKNRPAWQRGRLNGIGGHIEEDEDPSEAMQREFMEECNGVVIHEDRWHEFVHMVGPSYVVHFFKAFIETEDEWKQILHAIYDTNFRMALDRGDNEKPIVCSTRLPPHAIPNLQWLVPLALDKDIMIPIFVKDTTDNGEGATRATPR